MSAFVNLFNRGSGQKKPAANTAPGLGQQRQDHVTQTPLPQRQAPHLSHVPWGGLGLGGGMFNSATQGAPRTGTFAEAMAMAASHPNHHGTDLNGTATGGYDTGSEEDYGPAVGDVLAENAPQPTFMGASAQQQQQPQPQCGMPGGGLMMGGWGGGFNMGGGVNVGGGMNMGGGMNLGGGMNWGLGGTGSGVCCSTVTKIVTDGGRQSPID